jgi:hypothetical protein
LQRRCQRNEACNALYQNVYPSNVASSGNGGTVVPASVGVPWPGALDEGAGDVLVAVGMAVDDGGGVIEPAVEPSATATTMHEPVMHSSPLLQSVCRMHAEVQPWVSTKPTARAANTRARASLFIG